MSEYDLSSFADLDDVDLDELARTLDKDSRAENSGLVALVDEKRQVKVLFTFEVSETSDAMTYKLTPDGKKRLINGFGRSSLERLEGTLALEDQDQLGLLLGLGQGADSDRARLAEGSPATSDLLSAAKEFTKRGGGKYIVCGSKRELSRLMSEKIQISKRSVANAGASLDDLRKSVGAGRQVYFHANGSELRAVTLCAPTATGPAAIEQEESRMAVQHAALLAMRREGLPAPASHFFKCPETGRRALLIERADRDAVRKLESRGAHFYAPATECHAGTVRYNMSELHSLIVGKSEIVSTGDACTRSYRINRQVSPASNRDLMALLTFNKLIGAEPDYASNLGYLVTSTDKGAMKLAVAPFSGVTPTLMDSPTPEIIRDSGMNGRTLGRLSVEDVVDADRVLATMHQAAPKEFETAFHRAKKVRDVMLKVLETEMLPNKDISKEQLIAIKRYFTTAIGDAPYQLDTGVVGSARTSKDSELKNQLAEDKGLAPPDDDYSM